jgi:hypothetical protein
MAILNPICADCGHDLQHHYAGAGNTGCTDGDCQCAIFVSKAKTTESIVDEQLTKLVQDAGDGMIPEDEARKFLGLPKDFLTEKGHQIVDELPPARIITKARTIEDVVQKVGSGEWDLVRAMEELKKLDDATEVFVRAGDDQPMTTEDFTRLIEEQIARSTSLLIDKAKEYASDIDRLHNFKVAAQLLGGTQEQALGGFLAKHVVSVFDMINSGKEYPKEVWNEKITDSINYLLILRAMQR